MVLPLFANEDRDECERWAKRGIETLEPVLGHCEGTWGGLGTWRTADGRIKFDELCIPRWRADDVDLVNPACVSALKQVSNEVLRDGRQESFAVGIAYSEDEPPRYSFLETPIRDGISRRSTQVNPVVRTLAEGLEASITGHDQCAWFPTPPMEITDTRDMLRGLAELNSGATAIQDDEQRQWILSFVDSYNAQIDFKTEFLALLSTYGIKELFIGEQRLLVRQLGRLKKAR
jgi:hypothetical protein